MKTIEIKGLKVSACHGVLESEKLNPQPFIFDVSVNCPIERAAASDNVGDTVNYAEICSLINAYCTENSFNLIERLAYGAAFKIMQSFPLASGAQVTVHKPLAPVGFPVSDVCVTAEIERCKVLLSLGSSCGDRQANLNCAVKSLGEVDGVSVLKVSDFIETPPYGGVAKNTFLNCAVLIQCLISPRALLEEIHKIEERFGRVRTTRWEDRTLDIDIILFGDKVVAEEGLAIPHPEYSKRDFVLVPTKQIAPDMVCPLTHKRIADM